MPGPSRTPTQLRTRSHEARPAPPLKVDPARRPALSAAHDWGAESDAVEAWLGHLAAGRIAVR